MAFSATYTDELLADLEPLLKKPQRVLMCEDTTALLGVKHFYALVGQAAAPAPGAAEDGAAANTDGQVAEETDAGAGCAALAVRWV